MYCTCRSTCVMFIVSIWVQSLCCPNPRLWFESWTTRTLLQHIWANYVSTLSFIVQRYHEQWSSLSTVRLLLLLCKHCSLLQCNHTECKDGTRKKPSITSVVQGHMKSLVQGERLCSHTWSPAVWTRALKYRILSVTRGCTIMPRGVNIKLSITISWIESLCKQIVVWCLESKLRISVLHVQCT